MSTQKLEKEDILATELELVSLLKNNPDILIRHPDLIGILEVPHQSGAAVSLIEKQVSTLRGNLKKSDARLRDLMEIAKDNDRLAQSRHRLAINLLNAREIDDAISVVLQELGNELNAEFARIKLFTQDEELLSSNPEVFITRSEEDTNLFSTMLKHNNPMCGRSSDEQRRFLFGVDGERIRSAAIIPLSAGEELGLLGLGSSDEMRFQRSMGTDFLVQIGELISASLAVHMDRRG